MGNYRNKKILSIFSLNGVFGPTSAQTLLWWFSAEISDILERAYEELLK